KDKSTATHPSYGMIKVHRFTGGQPTFFGSSIRHDGGISISIHEAEVDRHLNSDWYHEKPTPIVEINMSYTQFSEMLTSGMNSNGTPCTIVYADKKQIERPEFVDKRAMFQNEFEDEMKNLKNNMEALVADTKTILSAKKAPTKAEKDLILNEIDSVTGTLTNQFTFLASQWNEQVDDTVKEAKAEIEGFLETKVRDLGVKALKSNIDILEIGETNAN
ncbi:MAG: hypothetical protein ACTSO3_16730, partial [Candidatus Heimdallarchaeaceae archaeon]